MGMVVGICGVCVSGILVMVDRISFFIFFGVLILKCSGIVLISLVGGMEVFMFR